MKLLFSFLLFFVSLPLLAQSDWREALHEWLSAEDMEESYGEELMEQLEELAQHPINLNQTSQEELETLPFLTATQVEEVVAYLDHYHPIRSLSELQMISALDPYTRRLLRYFVVAGEEKQPSASSALADVLKHGRHTLMLTGKIPFYVQEADRTAYLGYKYRHDIRYQFSNHHLKAGVTAAQDAGEPFFADKNRMGYDQYNYYVQLRDIGCLEELNLGHYRVQMGMGLVMNTRMLMGKQAALQTMQRSQHTLSAHSSRSSANHLQGIAATVRLASQWRLTAFASYQAIDATLNDDGSARTLLSSGYHRTASELEKKHNTHETNLGTSLGWQNGALHIHANAVYTHYDRSLQPDQSVLYRTYAVHGHHFLNASLDYGWRNHRWTLSGETALNQQGVLAAIHTLNGRLTSQFSLMLLHRYYDKRYTALHANSLREGSSIQNEHGIYVGGMWTPSRSWLLQGYADYAHFSWPRYQVSAASDAFDASLSARYSKKQWLWKVRYRLHLKQHDNATKNMLVNQLSHRLRMVFDWTPLSSLLLRLQADGVVVREQGASSRGVMVGQQVRWQTAWLKLTGCFAWYHTDDYDSRLYPYEPSVQYDYSFSPYYGRGIRYALMAQAHLAQHLTLATKFSVTNSFDRSSQAALLLQIGYTF